jgi:hypothetical protein
LNPDTDYYYKIASQNGIGTGAQSEAAASTKAPSTAPTGLSADGTRDAQSVYVSWEAVARATHYCLYRAEGVGGEYALVASVSGLSHTDGGLARGTDYYYQVSAANGAGEGPRAEPVIAAIPQLAAPSGLSAAAASKTSIRVSWNTVAGATDYTLYRAASSSGTYSALATVAGTSYTHTGLSAGTEYSYQVSATNELGTGTKSAAVSAYTLPTPLSDGVWHTSSLSQYGYDYYSFPASGGTYRIQWENTAHTGEASTDISVSAYWKSGNSMTGLSASISYFADKTGGFAAPQSISAPDSGYIIVQVYRHYDFLFYAIRYRKE